MNADTPTAEDLDEQYLKENIPTEPISSLKELQYWYGVIEMAQRGYKSSYGIHLTEFGNADAEDSLLYCDFIRTESGLEFDGVSLRQYMSGDPEQHEQVMFVKYGAPRGKENSITQKTPKDPKPEKVVSTVNSMIDWVFEDSIQEFITQEDEDDIQLLKQIESVSEDEETRNRIIKAVKSEISDDPTESLVTIRVKEDGEWKYPGDYPELVEAMRYRRLMKNVQKTSFTVGSTGKGKTFINNTEEELVGTPEDSFQSFKSKQQSTFTNLINDESSWMSNPISFEESLHIALSENIVENFYENIFNHRVYFLPYFSGQPTVRKSKQLYVIIQMMTSDTGKDEYQSQRDLLYGILSTDQFNGSEELNFYTIGLNRRSAMFNLLYTIPRLKRPHIVKMAEDYAVTVNEIVGEDKLFNDVRNKREDVIERFNDEEATPTMFDLVLHQGQDSVDWNIPLYLQVLSGYWIKRAYKRRRGNQDFDENDSRSRLYQSILESSSYSWSTLINEFLGKVLDYEAEQQGSNASITNSRIFVHQLGLLGALLEQGIVQVPNEGSTRERIKMKGENMSNMTKPVQELESAIESLPDSVTPEHIYAFSVGGLVGRLSEYQRDRRDMKKTILTDHPISRMNDSRLREALTDFADKASVYDLFGYTDQLNFVRETQPSFENLSHQDNNDIRYFYALGVAFGESQHWNSDD